MPVSKFNFIPYRQFKTVKIAVPGEHRATYNVKSGRLTFSSQYMSDRNLENQFIKVFFDPVEKGLAWAVVRGDALNDFDECIQIKSYGASWGANLAAKKAQQAYGFKDETPTFKSRFIYSQYKDSNLIGTVDYIILKHDANEDQA